MQAARSPRTNSRWLLLLCAVVAPSLTYAQAADQLLRETAKNYQTLTSYEMSGRATVTIPGSVWQSTGNFTVIGPRKEPSLLH